MHLMTQLALLVLLVANASAQDTWETYSHPDPPFSIDYPSTWTATLADEVPDETWGDLALKGLARVTFRVALDLDVLQVSIAVLGSEKEITHDQLLEALKARAKADGHGEGKVAFRDSPGMLQIGDDFQKAGRTIARTHVLDGVSVYCVELSVPDAWAEQCRDGYGHMVESLLISLQSSMAQPKLPSAEQFASELVAVIDATRRLDDAEMVRLFDEGNELMKQGLAHGHRSLFHSAAFRFQAMLGIDPDVAIGHFALGLAHFYAGEMQYAWDEFRDAISLDAELEPLCPLLWWEEFHELPGPERLACSTPEASQEIALENGCLVWRSRRTGRGDPDDPLQYPQCYLDLSDPAHPWTEQDTRTIVRFREARPASAISVSARADADAFAPNPGRVFVILVQSWAKLNGEGFDPTPQNLGETRFDSPAHACLWHVAEFTVRGGDLAVLVDGRPIQNAEMRPLAAGRNLLCLSGPEVRVDWVSVIRQ